jgi:hypothetical protein
MVGRPYAGAKIDTHYELPFRRIGCALALALALTFAQIAPVARAQDSSNDLLVIAKSSLLGGLLGLVLGGVTALVVDSEKRDDSVRWGIVLGTFAGFGYGVYTVTTDRDDDDFFGAIPENAGSWIRPLPGEERHARFARLANPGTSATRIDPFRTTSSLLVASRPNAGSHERALNLGDHVNPGDLGDSADRRGIEAGSTAFEELTPIAWNFGD